MTTPIAKEPEMAGLDAVREKLARHLHEFDTRTFENPASWEMLCRTGFAEGYRENASEILALLESEPNLTGDGTYSGWQWHDRFVEEFPYAVEAMEGLEELIFRDGKFDAALCLRLGTMSKRLLGILSSLSTYRRGFVPQGALSMDEPIPFVPLESEQGEQSGAVVERVARALYDEFKDGSEGRECSMDTWDEQVARDPAWKESQLEDARAILTTPTESGD